MKSNRAYLNAVALSAMLICVSPAAHGQESQAVDMSASYSDCTFGFSIPHAQGAIAEREKRTIRPAVMEIVRFVLTPRAWSQAVWFEDSDRPLSNELILERLHAELQSEFRDAEIGEPTEAQVAARPAVRLQARFTSQNAGWIRHQVVVRTGPSECFHIILLAPQRDAREAEMAFERVLAGFTILRSDAMQQRLKEAMNRGQRLLREISQDVEHFRTIKARNTFLRLVEQGENIGFMRIREEPTQWAGQDGIGIVQHTWVFRPTGEVTQSQQEMFLTPDLSHARWDSRIRILTPARGDRKEEVGLSVEHGIHEKDRLIVSYTQRLNDAELKDKIIQVDHCFAPPAWFVLLPRLVDLKKPEVYAFAAYDGGRRGLIVRTLEVAGEDYLTVDGKRLAGFRLLDGEGLVEPFNEINVDAKGSIQRVESGPLQMLVTTDDWIREHYTAKIDAALAQMKKHPVKSPRPATGRPGS